MRLFLLVLVAGGSAALSFRAWTRYRRERQRFAESEDTAHTRETPLVLALVFVFFLVLFLSFLLTNSLRLSFVESALTTVGLVSVGQWLAIRFFGRKQARV